MADDRPARSDEGGADIDDDVIDELRRCNPVDAAALPSSRSTEAARTLEQILTSDDESPSDSLARDLGGREEPPPRPPSR